MPKNLRSVSETAMYQAMQQQPVAIAQLLADVASVDGAVEHVQRAQRVFVVGTGTSFHAANVGAWWLREAGCDARAVAAFDFANWPPKLSERDLVILVSHTNGNRYGKQTASLVTAAGAKVVTITARGADGDIQTAEKENSDAHTISYITALMRLAQLAEGCGAQLGDLAQVPGAVSDALSKEQPFELPKRLVEFVGGGINQWTAAEGSLKIRETAYVAAEGLAVEQFLHGPSVALGVDDLVVLLDGGGRSTQRLDELQPLVEVSGAKADRIIETSLGELLSVFPLTVHVQRIALRAAELLRTNPDSFGMDLPGRVGVWDVLEY